LLTSGFILSDLTYSEEFPTFREYHEIAEDGGDPTSVTSSQDLDDEAGDTDDSQKQNKKDSSTSSSSRKKVLAANPDSGSGAEEEYQPREDPSQPREDSPIAAAASSRSKRSASPTPGKVLVKQNSKSSPRGGEAMQSTGPRTEAKAKAKAEVKAKAKARFVNWIKMTMLAHTFGDILRFQRTPFVFPDQKPEVAEFVGDLSRHSWFLSELELAEMSKNIEPDQVDTPGLATDSSASPSAKDKSRTKASGPKKATGKKTAQYEDLTRDQALFNKFKEYLAQRFNAENLLFFEAVNRFKNLDFSQHGEVRVRADDINKKFITGDANNAEFVIGINPSNARDIKKFLANNEITPLLFDRALEEVEHVTLKPSFADFIRTLPS